MIINEIMYHPPNDLDNLQFVELFNRGQAAMDLSNWSFSKGIKFTFPANTKIEPGGHLVVCRNLATFTAQYGKEARALGDFSGKLSQRGDRLELSNAQKKIVDAVKYADRDGWPKGADGHSPSLERICPQADSQAPENWAASKLPAIKTPGGTPGRKNDSFTANLPPVITNVTFKVPAPGKPATVTVAIADAAGEQSANLLYRIARTGRASTETSVPMKRISGDEKNGVYEAVIPAQPDGTLVRLRIQAADVTGAVRFHPAESEPRPTFSYYSLANTNQARVPFGFIINVGRMGDASPYRWNAPRRGPPAPPASRGAGAFIYVPPEGGEVQTFDYVRVNQRHGGFKVHFQKDQALKQMTGINLVFEGFPRHVLSEPLAYEIYRLAGVPAELSEHVRLWVDGQPLGYHLLVEQPNKSFLARNGRDDSGNLYKLLWYGNGVVGKHEKKTNPRNGHEDLVKLIDGLNKSSGAEQWEFIKANFNLEEMASYFAVNMCIQNWDGFFNNYFVYHDTGKTGKWELYPWDEDKTWGDYDGVSLNYDWYELPLTYGMNGDRSPRDLFGKYGQGPFGGVSWWRPPGYFSGPLLANSEFRKLFLARLREICNTIFTEQKVLPIIDALAKRLEPEIRFHAETNGSDTQQALAEFRHQIQSFRNQLKNRRKFILSELK